MKNKRSAKQWLEYISPVIESSPSRVDERTSMKNEKNDMQWLEYISPFIETSPSRVISPFTETSDPISPTNECDGERVSAVALETSDPISPTNEAVETMTKKHRTNIKRRPKRNKKEIRRATSCDTQRVKTNVGPGFGVVDWLRSVIAWTGSLMSKVWEALGFSGRDALNREGCGKP
jgi:hypothetical protein